jgi:hypothetical protein
VRILPALVLVAALAGCSAASPQGGAALTATLVSATSVRLDWQGSEPGAAGYAVEFATDPDGTWTVLQFVPAGQHTYTHQDLMPQTTFYYRLRPYFGPTSAPVEVNLPPGDFDENAQQGDQDWAKPHTVAGGAVAKQPIRSNAGGAAPTDLKATVKDANGIQFTWTDHASDEEGYLLEVRPAASAAFTVADVLDPDVNSCGLVTLPNEKHSWYRVRPFYYGAQSNVVHQTIN